MNRKMMTGLIVILGVSMAFAAPPSGDCKKMTVFTESFADGIEAGDGHWWHHFNVLTNLGGKNKEYIYSGPLFTHYPSAHTEMNAVSEFHGNYAARGVTSIGIDLATIKAQLNDYTEMSPTLMLVNDSDTPDDISDDCIVFFQSGETMPLPDPSKPRPNWTHYEFSIPSDSTTLPTPNNGGECWMNGANTTCWGVDMGRLCPVIDDPDLVWQTVINDVDQIQVSWMSPEWFRIIETWESAIDNPSISSCQ